MSLMVVWLLVVGVVFAVAQEGATNNSTVLLPPQEALTNDIIYPEIFGEHSAKEFASALPCGEIMATYNDIHAFSNGGNQGSGGCCNGTGTYGCKYQCVEFVQRYFGKKYNTQSIWPVSYAKQMCGSHPSGVKKTSSPKAGDAVVFDWGTYGHTAIVKSVKDGYVHVIEQNAAASGTNAYATSAVSCYLTAQ